MADNHSKEVRSYNMSQIRSANSKPEVTVRKFLFSHGFRYRKNDKRYPGKPDIVLPKYKTIIFVNGCFWHMHNCSKFVWPKSNIEYWYSKIHRNVERDNDSYSKLKAMGWNVIVIWECEINDERLKKMLSEIKGVENYGVNQQG